MNNIDSDGVPPGLLEARLIAYEIARRSNWKKRKRDSKSQQRRRAQEASDWRARVDAARAEVMEPVSVEKMRSIYTLLAFLLLTAPTEEDGNWLYSCIGDLKSEIAQHSGQVRLRIVHS